MTDVIKPARSTPATRSPLVAAAPGLVAGAMFGLVFGFLLQKGGVGKYNVLIGQLLLQDWTVAKIVLTAIVVGMIGVLPLHHFGKVNLHLKPTRVGANIIGGLLFGAGFALMGYCPGTAAVALGQGSWDALFGMTGLVVGSWLFAELSGWAKRTIEKRGDYGEVRLPDLVGLPRGVFAACLAAAIIAILFALHQLTVR